MRALVVSNMLPDASAPERGRFVRDQVAALRALGDVEVELYEFAPGPRALALAARDLRRRHGGPSTLSRRPSSEAFDVVHAHFGLSAWPALAVPAAVRALTLHGTDISHPRTRLATAAILPFIGLPAAVSAELLAEVPGRRARSRGQVLPCGVDLERFRPGPRAQARAAAGRDPGTPYLLFPASPARTEKRHDRAQALAAAAQLELVVLGGIKPERVPALVNGATAVVVPSEREGFGLAVLEALACDVPVLATPVGVHADALEGVEGTLCAPFELDSWLAAVNRHLEQSEPRVHGRASAERYSATAMAQRVRDAWQAALARSRRASG